MVDMAREYRIYMEEYNTYSDEPNGYMALINAKALSYTYGKITVKEQHKSRWFTIAETVNGEFIFKGKKKDYYILPTDQYGQPSGQINTMAMTKAEAILLEKTHGYVFDNYIAACYRAQA